MTCSKLKSPAATRRWRASHPEKFKASVDSWRQENRERVRAYDREARAVRRQRGQTTLSQLHKKEIAAIYRACPKGLQVDHQVPLRGEFVSGLHVPWNLGYLTASANAAKGNRF